MSEEIELQEALNKLIDDLIEIHDHKRELFVSIGQAEVYTLVNKSNLVPIVNLINWVRSDLETVRGMTDTLIHIARSLRRDVKRKRRNTNAAVLE